MPQGGDVTLIILKGHLLIEEVLERIIRTIVAHGELLENVRLTFYQKASLARAMCWGKHDSDVWPLLFQLNALRNDLAHSLEPTKFDEKLKSFLAAVVVSVETGASKSELAEWEHAKNVPEPELLKYAVALVLGFLGSYESDASGYRGIVDKMLAALRESK